MTERPSKFCDVISPGYFKCWDQFFKLAASHRVRKLQVGEVMIEFESSEKEESKTDSPRIQGLGKSDPEPTADDLLMWSTGEPLSHEKQVSEDIDPA